MTLMLSFYSDRIVVTATPLADHSEDSPAQVPASCLVNWY
jgi:hypothetical protein